MQRVKHTFGAAVLGATLTVALGGCGLFGATPHPATHPNQSRSQNKTAPQTAPSTASDNPSQSPPAVQTVKAAWIPNHQAATSNTFTTYLSPSEAWRLVSANPPTIWKTTNGGRNWTAVSRWSSTLGTPEGISFVSPQIGWMGVAAPKTGTNILYQTTDGGYSWSPVAVPSAPSAKLPIAMTAHAPFWTSTQDALLVAYSGHINQVPGPTMWLWATDNGGASWIREAASGPGHLGTMAWQVPHQGTIAVTSGTTTWQTTNYGASWALN